MQSNLVAASAKAARITFLSCALILLGFCVGMACVVLPQGIPFAIVGLAVAVLLWTLPDLQTVPDRLAGKLLFPFIVSSISIPVYFAIILPGLPWISLRRLILFLFVGTIALTLAASSELRKHVTTVAKSSPLLLACTFGYFILNVCTVAISPRLAESLNYTVNTTMTWWIPLVAVLLTVNTIHHVKNVFGVIIGCMTFDMLMGVIETRLHSPFLIYMMPASMRAQMVAQFPMYVGLLSGSLRNGIYRAVSTYNTALSWGEMSAMAGPIAAHFLAHGRNSIVRSMGAICLAGCLYSIYMSGSRGGYVGFTAAMIVYFALWAIRHMRVKPASLMGATTLVLYSMFSVAVLLSIVFVGRIHRVVLGGGEVQASNEGRSMEWAMALPKFYQSPIWGHGYGTAADVVGFVNLAGNPTLDSYMINVLVDTGFLGLTLFAGMILGSVFLSLKHYVTNTSDTATPCGAIGCSLIAYALYRLTLSQTENNTLAYILVGLTFSLTNMIRSEMISRNPITPKDSQNSVSWATPPKQIV